MHYTRHRLRNYAAHVRVNQWLYNKLALLAHWSICQKLINSVSLVQFCPVTLFCTRLKIYVEMQCISLNKLSIIREVGGWLSLQQRRQTNGLHQSCYLRLNRSSQLLCVLQAYRIVIRKFWLLPAIARTVLFRHNCR